MLAGGIVGKILRKAFKRIFQKNFQIGTIENMGLNFHSGGGRPVSKPRKGPCASLSGGRPANLSKTDSIRQQKGLQKKKKILWRAPVRVERDFQLAAGGGNGGGGKINTPVKKKETGPKKVVTHRPGSQRNPRALSGLNSEQKERKAKPAQRPGWFHDEGGKSEKTEAVMDIPGSPITTVLRAKKAK